MRRIPFIEKEFYHIYNRGVDKRKIFSKREDLARFFQSMNEFNTIDPIGSIYQKSFDKNQKSSKPLVQFVAFCLNPNHFHFLITQLEERGIEKFMHRLGTGYTRYFNEKYKRSGALFQGRFKASHIDTNEYLLHASAYVNLNFKAHRLSEKDLYFSSWSEYQNLGNPKFCNKKIILEQFKTNSGYLKFAQSSLTSILKRKEAVTELENDHLEVQPLS